MLCHLRFLYLSLKQGVDEGPEGLKLISDLIREKLKIEISVLMGANIANEVADEMFCETTIGNYGINLMATDFQARLHSSEIRPQQEGFRYLSSTCRVNYHCYLL